MERLANTELRVLTLEQLHIKLNELRRDFLELRLKSATTHVKSFPSDKRMLKRSIAQVLTHIRHKYMTVFANNMGN